MRARWSDAYAMHSGSRRKLEAALGADLDLYLPHLLNRQDKNTMQHSIETRVPFLDPQLVALAVNLPLELRTQPARKGILRELAARHLPAAVVDAPKVGFGFDVAGYIAEAANPQFLIDGQLRELLAAPIEPWREAIAQLAGHAVQLAWTSEIWCRLMLGGQSIAGVEADLWRGDLELHRRPVHFHSPAR